jgi:hypothetical protein
MPEIWHIVANPFNVNEIWKVTSTTNNIKNYNFENTYKFLFVMKKVWIIFNYIIFQMSFYNLELIQNFFPDHKVLIRSLIIFLWRANPRSPSWKKTNFNFQGPPT